ncbi:myo-inositol oxygenase [Dermatophagoides farinae]|uniref:myo-inositol oxygenase n=1 Tax=Dermatophagoides farinae TaxID=6954 RepID=UPI003F6388F0
MYKSNQIQTSNESNQLIFQQQQQFTVQLLFRFLQKLIMDLAIAKESQQEHLLSPEAITTANVLRKKSNDSLASESIYYLDPSEHFRPEHKSPEEYRIYTINQDDYIQKRVFDTYRLMHTNQTLEFARNRLHHWTRFDKLKMTIMDALENLNCLVDESDPDVDLPNIIHAFQTAERIREAHPDLDWFHLTGLIHDLGKLMAVYGEPQWAVVGDTFPLGCQVAKSVVYAEQTFMDNPDTTNSDYNTEYGIYQPNCGLKQVVMSWGHDEYMYQVLKNHPDCSLPEQAFYIIRFHSFYPWHTGGDYYHLCSKHDLHMLPWIREFNKFDLYSKTPEIPDIPKLVPYYQSLIDKYIPGLVSW